MRVFDTELHNLSLWLVMLVVWAVGIVLSGGVLRGYTFLLCLLSYFLGMFASGIALEGELTKSILKAAVTSLVSCHYCV